MERNDDPLMAVPAAADEGARGSLADGVKKALLAGVGALFLTEEGARRLLRWYQEHADRVPEIRWRRVLHEESVALAYMIDEKEHRFTGEVRSG